MALIPPHYVVKVITLDGTVIADPLPAANVRFTRRLALPGDRQLGTFSIDLIPPRGPNAHYMAIYTQLDYIQRVEIYENETVGNPVFSGYIIDLDSTLLGWSISGEDWLGRLAHRRLGHYEPFYGTVTGDDLMGYVLNVWDHSHFFDNFNRASVGGDWTAIGATTWDIVTDGDGRQWLGTTGAGSAWEIQHTLGLSTDQDDRFRVRIEFQAGTETGDWTREFAVFRGGTGEWLLTATHTATEEKTHFTLTQAGADDFERDAGKYELPFEKKASIDFWIEDSAASPVVQTCEIWLNGRQFMISESTFQGISGALALEADETNALFDNVIIFTREPLMTPNITTASSTIGTEDEPYESPQDTQLQLLSSFADNIFYEWRTRAGSGAGADIIDLATSVGSDLSSSIRFVEGVNLQNLQLNPSGKALTTWYRFAGQGNDVNMALAEAFDKTAIETYGIIENQLSDQRISTVDLAQQKAENELVRAKDGEASMSATIFVHPGLPDFDVGDTVQVVANVPDIDQSAKIVSISYESQSPARQVTFDQFPRSRSGMIGKLNDGIDLTNRGKSLNAGEVILKFSPGSRYIDDGDSRFGYVDTRIANQSWLSFINTAPPEPNFFPWFGTLSFGSEPGLYAEISLACTALRLVHYQRGNLTLCQVVIDGVNANVIDQRGAQVNQVKSAVDFTGFSDGLHIFRFQKEASVDANVSRYITIDGLILDSYLWHDIFLEGRAVNRAYLSFTFSNVTSPPPVQIWINGTDRTVALGGAAGGFTTSQTRLNVSNYISAPGQHQIDFRFVGSNEDTSIEAVLAASLFV